MQKEQLSALMDGETLDSELLNELAHNPEMQKTWESYHLIRDSMRGDTPEVLHFDISSRVMAAIEEEPVRQPATLIPEAQPAPHQWQKMPFWQKVRPWAAQLTQMGVARLRIPMSFTTKTTETLFRARLTGVRTSTSTVLTPPARPTSILPYMLVITAANVPAA